MADITLKLDPEALREATAQAIMGVLTPEMRANLISSAITSALAPSTNSWDRGKSPLQAAFDQAVVNIARAEVGKIVETDEALRTQLAELMRDVTDKVLKMDREKLSSRMADAFVDSLRRD